MLNFNSWRNNKKVNDFPNEINNLVKMKVELERPQEIMRKYLWIAT